MKMVKNYLWCLLIFSITPFLGFVMLVIGVSTGLQSKPNREFSNSVYQRMNLVFILYFLVAILIDDLYRSGPVIWVSALLMLAIFCQFIFAPQILLSYETWNWWKLTLFQARLQKYDRKDDRAITIKMFLETEARNMNRADNQWAQQSFDHLFYLFRILEYWRESKRTLLEQAGVPTNLCND